MKTRKLGVSLIFQVIFTFLVITNVLGQQVWPVQVTGALIPPRSLDLDVYTTERTQDLFFNAMLNDPVQSTVQVTLDLSVEHNGQVIYQTDPNFFGPPLTLSQFQQIQLNGGDLQPYLTPQALTGANNTGTGSLEIPEGFNRICLQVYGIDRTVPISNKFCVQGSFQLNQPPQLTLPTCGEQMPLPETQNVIFNWAPMHLGSANSPVPVEYLFELVALPSGTNNANDAFDSALKLYQTTSMTPSLLYTQSEPLLEADKLYAWRVQAYSILHPTSKLFQNNGYSEVCTFMYYTGDAPNTDITSEDKPVPTGCEVFNTDYGPVSGGDLEAFPIVEEDVVKLGYFNMEITQAIAGASGFSGEGLVSFPMFKSKIKVNFSGLRVNENMRVFDAENVEAAVGQQFYIEPSQLQPVNVPNLINETYVNNLKSYFENGQGVTKLTSGFNPADPVAVELPIGLDKDNANLISIIGIKFTPRNAYLNMVSWSSEEGGDLMRFAATAVPVTPLGMKSGSHLVLLDGSSGGSVPITGAFEVSYAGDSSTKMNCDCQGFKDLSLSPNIQISTNLLAKEDGKPLILDLKNDTNNPENYIGAVRSIPNFTINSLPDFVFNPKKGQLDLSETAQLEFIAADTNYTEPQQPTWRGLVMDDVKVTLPESYDFTGNGNKIELENGQLIFDDKQIAFGNLYKENMLSLEEGKMGNWAYSVNKFSLEINEGQVNGTTLEGNIQVPIFTDLFDYRGSLQANSSGQIVLGVEIPETPLDMGLWKAGFESAAGSTIDAKLIDVDGTQTFIPSANLNGSVSMNLDSIDIAQGIQQNTQIVINDIKQRLQYEGELSFELEGLELNGLILNPFDIPENRIKLTDFDNAGANLKVGGKILTIGGVEILYNPSISNAPEEIVLKILAENGNNQVGFEFWAKANNDGKFEFDRIEIDAKEINCECTSDVSNPSVEDIGALIDEIYKNDYQLRTYEEATGSLASLNLPTVLDKNSDFQKVYEKAIKTYLQNTIYPNGILPVKEGVYVDFLKMKVERDPDNKKNAATASTLTNKSAYTFEKINANTNASGDKKLPIDLTNMLKTISFGGSIPDNTKLLITKLKNLEGSATLELTLLVKIGNDYLTFSKDNIAFTSTAVSFANLKLKLNETKTLAGNFPLTFEKTNGNGVSVDDSWVAIDCTKGLTGYNIQGYYEPKSTAKIKFADGLNANFGFRLDTQGKSSHDLNNFQADLKETNNMGDSLEFSLADHGLLTFVSGENFKGYLDFSNNSNPAAIPADYSRVNTGGTGGFKGLVFENLAAKVTGLYENSNETTPLTLPLNKFVLHPNHGMYGAADLSVIVTEDQNAKMDGWGYSLSKLDFSIEDGNLVNNAVNIEGILDVPVFAEDSEFNFTGTLGWDATAKEPKGSMAPNADDLEDVFDVTWIPGLEINLDPGSTVEMHVKNGKFSPTAVFNGGAGIYFTPEMSIAGLSHSFEFGYDVFTFQNWKVNDHSLTGQGALKKIDFGVWGTKDKKKKRKRKKGRGKKKMKGFPITLEIPTFTTLQSDGTYEMDLGISLNLMKGGAGGSKGGGKSKASGLRATTILEFDINANGSRLEQTGVKLDSIDVAGKFGKIAIRGIGVSIEKDPVYGDAFKIGVQVKMPMGKKKVEVAGLAQFGSNTDGGTGNFRYFFVDVQVLMDPPKKMGKFNFHGGIGGFLYNMRKPSPLQSLEAAKETSAKKGFQPVNIAKLMKKSASKLSTKKQAKLNLETYMAAGKSFTGESYLPGIPEDGGKYFGGYIEGIFSMGAVKQYPIAAEVGLMLEFQTNSAGDFGFSRMQVKGKGYLMPGSIPTRHEDNLGQGFVALEYDLNEQRISGAMHVDVKLAAGGNALKVAAEIEGKLLLDWGGADEGSWYLKLGSPTKPNRAGIDIMGFGVGANFYFQLGNKLDAPPPLRDVIPGGSAGSMGSTKPERFGMSGVSNGNGFMAGLGFEQRFGGRFGPFYASAKWGIGFDIAAIKYDNIICNGEKRTDFGIDGLYFQGQIYGYAAGSVGVDVDIKLPFWRIKGRYKAIDVAAGMVVAGAFPNPTQVLVKLKGQYSLFGGVVSGNVNWEKKLGEGDIDLSCTPETPVVNVTSPGAAPFVASISLEDGAEEVNIFEEPELNLNYEAGKIVDIPEVDMEGGETGRRIQFKGGFEYLRLKLDDQIADTWIDSPNAKKKIIKLNALLAPEADYVLEYESKWERRFVEANGTEGAWSKITEEAPESGSISFTTGPMPQKILAEALNYHAPGNKQKYWHKGYARPRIAFKNGDWSYLFPPGTTDWINALKQSASKRNQLNLSLDVVKSLTEGVDFEYKVLLIQYAGDGTVTAEQTFEFPLSNYPNDETFRYPVIKIRSLGEDIKIPYTDIATETGKDVVFAELDNFISKEKLYNIKIFRDLSDNDKIPSAKTELYQSELYSYWFSTSKYNSLKDKIEKASIEHYHQYLNNGLFAKKTGHPDEPHRMFLDINHFAPKGNFYVFKVDEDFDKYDLQRFQLNLNPKIVNGDSFATEKALKDYVNKNYSSLSIRGSIGNDYGVSSVNMFFQTIDWSQAESDLQNQGKAFINKIPSIVRGGQYTKYNGTNYGIRNISHSYFTRLKIVEGIDIPGISIPKPLLWRDSEGGSILNDSKIEERKVDRNDNTSLVFVDNRAQFTIAAAHYIQIIYASNNSSWMLPYISNLSYGPLYDILKSKDSCSGCSNRFTNKKDIKLRFPNLTKWDDMGQKVVGNSSPKLVLTLKTPQGNGQVSGAHSNGGNEAGTWTTYKHKNHAGYWRGLRGLASYPADKKPNAIWVVKKASPDKPVLYWSDATREAMIYKADHSGEKLVLKNKDITNTDAYGNVDHWITYSMSLSSTGGGYYDNSYGFKDLYDAGSYTFLIKQGDKFYWCDNCGHGTNYSTPSNAQRDAILNLFSEATQPFRGQPIKIPGSFSAVEFDKGGQGIAYNDNDIDSNPGQYRSSESVDIATQNGIHRIGWTGAGEWLKYTVNIESAGVYDLNVIHSAGNSKISVALDDTEIASEIALSGTGGYTTQNYTTHRVMINETGNHLLKISLFGGMDIFGFEFVKRDPMPYNGVPFAVPGTIPGHEFDRGGQSISYYDTTPDKNEYSSTYRTNEGVETSSDRVKLFAITTPTIETAAGNFEFFGSEFTTLNKVSGKVVLATPNLACGSITNASAIAGNIALIDRGTCSFEEKVFAAQNAGAIAALICSDNRAPILMGTSRTGNSYTIPAMMISNADGNLLKAKLPSNLTLDLSNADAEWVKYTIDVKESGNYEIFASIGGGNDPMYQILLDDKELVASADGITKGNYLEKGIHQLKFKMWGDINLKPNSTLYYLRITKENLPTQPGKSPIALPGKGQFEDFGAGGKGVAYHDTKSEPSIETSGSRKNVGFVENEEWLAYPIKVTAAGEYPLLVRHANYSKDAEIKLVVDGNELGTFTLPSTGGWGNYKTTYAGHYQIPANAKEVRFLLSTGTNLDWFEFSDAQPTAYSTQNNIPGNIWCGHYGEGGLGIAHNEPFVSSSAGYFRNFIRSGTPSSYQSDLPDRWIKYVVNVDASGKYNWEMEYQADASWNVQLFVDGNPITTVQNMPSSQGQLKTRSLGEVELTKGEHVFKFLFPKVSPKVTSMNFHPAEQMPHSGTPAELPGTVQAEEYDLGGEGLAFHDETNDDVDLNSAKNAVIGNNNEWIYYTVNLTDPGNYEVTFKHSNNSGTHKVSLHADGEVITENYNLVGGQKITSDVLSAGEQVLKLQFHNNGTIIDDIKFELPPQPFAGASNEIPGIIELEDFNTGGQNKGYKDSDDVNDGGAYRTNVGADIYNKSETTASVGGGAQSTYVRTGANEWLSYTANITTAGMYAVTARYCAAADAKMIFSLNGSVKGGNGKQKLLKSTGGNCESNDYEEIFLGYYDLPEGEHNIRLSMKSGIADIDYLSFEAATREPWSGTPAGLPGRIQVEHFDKGGEGIGYHDIEEGHRDSKKIDLRPNEDVEISSYNGIEKVGYNSGNEWMDYSVNVTTPGAYVFKVRYGRRSGNSSLKVLLDGNSSVLTTVTINATGGWTRYKTASSQEFNLPEGEHVVRLLTSSESINLDWFEFVQSQPYNGQAQTIPGKVEAEFYDEGGEGLAFHDADAQRRGNLRNWRSGDEMDPHEYGGSIGKVIAHMGPNEWAQYTIDVQSDGYYEIYANASTTHNGRKISLEIDGKEELTNISIPKTGDWRKFEATKLGEMQLTRGIHKLRWKSSTGSFNLNYLRLEQFRPAELEVTGNGNTIANDINAEVSTDNLTAISSQKRVAKTVNFKLKNPGGRPLVINKIDFGTNTDKNVFSLSNLPSLPLTIPIGSSKTISIVFNPREGETYTGSIAIQAADVGDYFFRLEGKGIGGAPYKGIPANIPGTIYAYKFDEGGKNKDYYDTSTGNSGNERNLRPSTDVDIYDRVGYYYCYDCVNESSGEWLHYTVNVKKSGTYELICNYYNYGGGEISIEKKSTNGYTNLGKVILKRYGYEYYKERYSYYTGWWWWRRLVTGYRTKRRYVYPGTKYVKTTIQLEEGIHTLRIKASSGSVYLKNLDFKLK